MTNFKIDCRIHFERENILKARENLNQIAGLFNDCGMKLELNDLLFNGGDLNDRF